MKAPSYDIRPCHISVVHDLCEQYHGYGGANRVAAYAFAVYENDIPVAAYSWQPPAPGASKSICPEFPQGVLALSRMVALPRTDRVLNHVSKPLKRQMKVLIDRTRYPVLVTYSDEGQGHTGHSYKCSGWEKTCANKVPYYQNAEGVRISSYSGGKSKTMKKAGFTIIQRWEHWVCERGDAMNYAQANGWRRVPLFKKNGEPKLWRSGNQAYGWTNESGGVE